MPTTWKNLFRLLKISPILLKFGIIALMTFIQKNIDQNFDIFLESRDFGPGSSRNLSLCKILNNFLYFTPSTPPPLAEGGTKNHSRKGIWNYTREGLTIFETRLAKMLLRYIKLAVLAIFDPISPRIQTHFSTWRPVATSSASRSCKTAVAPSISPCWFHDPWVNTPTWPALLPPAYVLGKELFFCFMLQVTPEHLGGWIFISWAASRD